VYNFAEDEFYIHRLKNLGYDCDIDDLEYMTLDKGGVNNEEVLLFKNYIEQEVQMGKVVIGVLLYKSKGGIVPVVIKPKNIDLEDIFNKDEV
jgi:hypothetical protein